MSNLEKWINAILNEDAEKLSLGSVRTLQMIKHEMKLLQKENKELQAIQPIKQSPYEGDNWEAKKEDYAKPKEVFPLSEIDSLKSDVATWKSFCEGYKEKYDEDQKEISNLKREINTLNTDYSEEVKRLNHIIENFGV